MTERDGTHGKRAAAAAAPLLLAALSAAALAPAWDPGVRVQAVGWSLPVLAAAWLAAWRLATAGTPSPRLRDATALALALAAGLFWWSVFHPAVMTADSIGTWRQALEGRYGTWHPPATALLMHLFQQVSDGPGGFAAVQAVVFWFALFRAALWVTGGPRRGLAACALCAANPVLWVYPVTLWKDVWTATCVVAALPFLAEAWRRRAGRPLVPATLLMTAASCFRHNALSAAVVSACAAWRAAPGRARWRRALGPAAVLLLAAAAPRLVERHPAVRPTPSAHIYLVTQYLGVVDRLDRGSDEFRAERAAFDRRFGDGKLEEVLSTFDVASGHFIGRIIFASPPQISVKELERHRAFIRSAAVRMAVRHPWAYARHKALVLVYAVGLRPSRSDHYYDAIIDNDLGLSVSSRLPGLRHRATGWLERSRRTALWWAWPALACSAAGLLLGWRLKRPAAGVASALALAYAAAFALPDVAPQFRYLLPSYLCALLGWLSLALGPPAEEGPPA